ncbi:N,N-dimethylformamidase beta subunit family domain-containing protein [Methylopila musalis]|uniref:N,N-dimethylformamidase beta subunit family domain-containing protein n=1 Tax=Methylopila musalis TaxID=1134781 RepID=A0ABW3Z3V3_9HYPH
MLNITAYSDQISILPGETVKVMVNCEHHDYQVQMVRILCEDGHPQGPGSKLVPISSPANGAYSGRRQHILAGSYGVVPHGPALEGLSSFTLQAWVMPTTPQKGVQAIVSKLDIGSSRGFALVVDETGALGLMLANGEGREILKTDVPMLGWEWYFVAASYDAASGAVALVQIPQRDYATVEDGAILRRQATLVPAETEAPLAFASWYGGMDTGRRKMGGFFNGKIDAPRLSSGALTLDEMMMVGEAGAPGHLTRRLVGAWDFSRDISTDRITDVTAHQLHGKVVNVPTRAVTGHNWDEERHCWTDQPEMWGAIHFHDDDIYDAEWLVDFEFDAPDDLPSGLYAALITSGEDREYVPFVVRPRKGREKTICLVLPTASYLAYANEHFATNPWGGELMWFRATVLDKPHIFLNEHREYGLSCYDRHSDNSPVYYSSRFRPILNMRPLHLATNGGFGSSTWQFGADVYIVDWLTEMGFEFDIITDEDLHAQGATALKPYACVLTGSHPEYTSKEMWDAYHQFQQNGGRFMYLGGNGFYWRISYARDKPGMIEIRRAEGGSRASEPPTGEYYLSTTGEYSGMWRRQGRRAPQVLSGVGFSAEGMDISSYYRQTPDRDDIRVTWMFEGIGPEEIIGDFGLNGGGAAGLELDRADRNLGTPPHALVVCSSERHTDAYMLVCEDLLFNLPGCTGTECDWVRSDITFYETPNGGAVWSVGSIAWAGSLSHDGYRNNVSRLTANVVRRFVDPEPFSPPKLKEATATDETVFA